MTHLPGAAVVAVSAAAVNHHIAAERVDPKGAVFVFRKRNLRRKKHILLVPKPGTKREAFLTPMQRRQVAEPVFPRLPSVLIPNRNLQVLKKESKPPRPINKL
jgi:hypothetical protein